MTGIAVSDPVEGNAFVDLVGNGFPRDAVARMECGIVTELTSSPADLSVAVGAGKTSIYDELLKPLAIDASVISYKSIVSLPVREIREHRLFLAVLLRNNSAELLV